MSYALQTIGYFVNRGTLYGLLLGAWSGTAIFPVIGTLYAAIWGACIGLACGLLCGLIVGVIQSYTFHPDVDLGRFRRRLMLGLGIFVPIAATAMLIVSSRGLLWGPGNSIHYLEKSMANLPLHLFCIMAIALWSSLSAAYVASSYPDWLVRLKTGAKGDMSYGYGYGLSGRKPIPYVMGTLVRPWINWGTLILGAIAGMAYQTTVSGPFVRNGPHPATVVIMGGGLGILASAIAILLLAFGNAALIVFLKKTIFAEDVLPLPPRRLRVILTTIALVFTGLASAWTLIFAPLCAVLMAQFVYDAFPLFDETFDKAKRKEKNALALEEEGEEGEAVDILPPSIKLSDSMAR